MDFEAKLNPAASFKTPQEVVANRELSRAQKIEVFKRWKRTRRRWKSPMKKACPGLNPNCSSPSVMLYS